MILQVEPVHSQYVTHLLKVRRIRYLLPFWYLYQIPPSDPRNRLLYNLLYLSDMKVGARSIWTRFPHRFEGFSPRTSLLQAWPAVFPTSGQVWNSLMTLAKTDGIPSFLLPFFFLGKDSSIFRRTLPTTARVPAFFPLLCELLRRSVVIFHRNRLPLNNFVQGVSDDPSNG